MEGCSSMSPWTNMYQQGGIETPGSISSLLSEDPAAQDLHMQPSWCDGGAPNNDHHLPLMNPNNMVQSQPFDTTSSIDQSLECLLSGTNSNTETSDEDDGISMLFSSDFTKNILNFSSNNNNNNNNHNNLISSIDNTSNNPRKRCHNSHILHENQDQFNITTSTNPTKGNKRQRSNTTTTATTPKTISNSSNNISFQQGKSSTMLSTDEQDTEAIQQMKEMIYRAAAFRPVNFGLDPIERPKRKNVRISNDPQTAAARQRRERISERLRVLQKLVPGGTKMDTASMLDEAANYLKFLRNQVKDLETFGNNGTKFSQFHFSTNINGNNHIFTPPSTNLQFSPMVIPIQSSHFLPSNPSIAHVPKS